MLIVFIRAVILYFVIIMSVRLMGKRQIGELQPSELVVTILLSNIATLPVEDMNIPMAMGIVPIFTLVSIDVIVSYLSMKSSGLRKTMSGSAKIIISEGKVNTDTLKELRFSADDLMAALRTAQVFDISEVQFAVVETTGKVSVMTKTDTNSSDPPMMIINDGKLSQAALRHLELTEKQIDNILTKENISYEDIYIMTADKKGKYSIIRKQDKQ